MCVELRTGEVVWQQRGSGRNSVSVAAADGRLFLHFSDGTVALAAVTPDRYNEISEFKTPSQTDRPTWALPSLANGRLYIREDDDIFCYDVAEHGR